MKNKLFFGMIVVTSLILASAVLAAPSETAWEKSGNFFNLFEPPYEEYEGWYIVGVKNPKSPGDFWGKSDTGVVVFDIEKVVTSITVMEVNTPTGERIINENFMGP
ncbi:MAG: hypothetical protein GTN40_02490 [Candidatus Aenigmarchaeota archaeon]|nr:hypothetical protein [Candidatus Aenigmarchaeota archaeon]